MINSNVLTIIKEEKLLVIEDSTLTGHYCQAYPDAADIGFRVMSNKTGKVAMFAMDGDKRNDEGEVQWWDAVPTQETLRSNPNLKGWKVRVFND